MKRKNKVASLAKKENIRSLGLDAIENYFGIDISKIEPKIISEIHKKAKIAMQFEREMNLTLRNSESNYLRVFKLIASDKKELKSYIRKALPKYIPK